MPPRAAECTRPIEVVVQRLDWRPGDLLIAKTRDRLSPDWRRSVEAALSEALPDGARAFVLDGNFDLQAVGPSVWQPFATAPHDGTGFLAYGRHAHDGRHGGYVRGDHWWAIIQFDIWREPHQFVFAKDGQPIADWGEPLCWQPLLAPSAEGEGP